MSAREEREWLAVHLTASEARRLNHDAMYDGEKCCGHLSLFHNRGESRYEAWSSCTLRGCNCTTTYAIRDRPPEPTWWQRVDWYKVWTIATLIVGFALLNGWLA